MNDRNRQDAIRRLEETRRREQQRRDDMQRTRVLEETRARVEARTNDARFEDELRERRLKDDQKKRDDVIDRNRQEDRKQSASKVPPGFGQQLDFNRDPPDLGQAIEDKFARDLNRDEQQQGLRPEPHTPEWAKAEWAKEAQARVAKADAELRRTGKPAAERLQEAEKARMQEHSNRVRADHERER
jgi:hypothetical protein